MLNFNHTCLYFKDTTRTYFCEIYVILWDLIGINQLCFQALEFPNQTTGGRSEQESVDRYGRPMCTGRAQRPATSAGRPTESTQLSGEAGRPGGRPGGRPLAQWSEK